MLVFPSCTGIITHASGTAPQPGRVAFGVFDKLAAGPDLPRKDGGHSKGQRGREGVGRNCFHVDHLRISIVSELFRQTFIMAIPVQSLLLLCCLKPYLTFHGHSRLPLYPPWI